MKSPLFQYDKAVYDLIHSLYDKVYYGSPDEIFSINAKKNEGKVLLPFISVYRLPDFSINTDMMNDSFLRNGWISHSDKSSGIEFRNQVVTKHGMPVTLEYQIEVYATKRDVCDGLTAELMMYLKAHPYVDVQLMDMGKKMQQFNFDLQESVVDNTDIMGFGESGRMYRLSMTAEITEAVVYWITDIGDKIDSVEIDIKSLGGSISMDIEDYISDNDNNNSDKDDGFVEVNLPSNVINHGRWFTFQNSLFDYRCYI